MSKLTSQQKHGDVPIATIHQPFNEASLEYRLKTLQYQNRLKGE